MASRLGDSGGGSHATSTFGKFRSHVGSKAGGFIAKKFFHPSSISNQRKVWQNMEKAKEKDKIEEERQRRREEERQVEELRREMQIRGQSKKENDVFKRTAQIKTATGVEAEAQLQQKKRVLALKRLDEEAASGSTSAPHRAVASSIPSRYKEDVLPRGHTEIWGSYYDPETQKWGYKCCQSKEKNIQCPLADPEEADTKKKRKKKRNEVQGGAHASNAGDASRDRNGSPRCSRADEEGGLRVSSSIPCDARASADDGRQLTSTQNSCENTSRLARLKKLQEEKTKKSKPATEDKEKKKAYVDDLFNDPCA